MSNDNPALPATGVTVRAIDRTGDATSPPAAPSGVTQVTQLDFAGATGPESLVSASNPLPVSVAELAAAKSSDSPVGVFVTGDPNGDFAGISIIEQLVDDGSGLAFSVRVINPPNKVDANGAVIISDCPTPIVMRGVNGSVFLVDTQGYQSFQIGIAGSSPNISPALSNDLISFATCPTASVSGGGTIGVLSNNLLSSGLNFIGPILGRYLRLTFGGGGSATLHLRSLPLTGAVRADLAIAGNAAIAAGNAGSLATGGAVASGASALGANFPLIVAGVDAALSAAGVATPIVRSLKADSLGRLVTAPLEDKGTPTSVAPGLAQGAAQKTTIYNNTAANVQDTTQVDGQSIAELLALILLEMRIHNQQLYELPQVLAQTLVTALQSSSSVLPMPPQWDDPAAYRADPTIFN